MPDKDIIEFDEDGVSKQEPNTPSLFKMIKTFSKDLTKYIKEGAPNVSPLEYAERLDACKVCPHLKTSIMRCGLCGCLLEHKAKWKTTDCPDKPSRWKKQIVEEPTDFLNG
tara:strand:+ start:101 stop:433 length:333 start_codon:yes stop_codon:yes gene_type:complete